MVGKKNFLIYTASLFIAAVLFVSCPSNEQYGYDADYFIGLQKLEEGNIKEAKQKFNSCIKKGTYYCAKESAIQLTKLGNLQENNTAAAFLYTNFPDSDSLLILAQQYHASNELRKLIEITNGIDFATADDSLVKLRLQTLLQLNQQQKFEDEAYLWFTSRTISQEQYQYFRDVYAPLCIPEETDEAGDSQAENLNPKADAVQFRITLYKRNYLLGYENAEQIFSYFENGELEPVSMLASDIGKSYLYGSDQIIKDAGFLYKKAEQFKETQAEFYFWFYAARLYDGGNLYNTQASKCYENAIASTDDPSKKDNALWYLIKTRLKISLDKTLDSIDEYAKVWNDPEYFDDIFDSLIPSLIVNGKWETFKDLIDKLDGYASKETMAQLYYLYGRFIECGYIGLPEEEREQAARTAFTKALDSGTSAYYNLLATYRLGLTPEMNTVLRQAQGPQTKQQDNTPSPVDNLLCGYATFGYSEKIYPKWLELYKNGASAQTGLYLANFLNKCAAEDDTYYTQALRIAARAANMAEQPLTKDQLKEVYPQNYSKLREFSTDQLRNALEGRVFRVAEQHEEDAVDADRQRSRLPRRRQREIAVGEASARHRVGGDRHPKPRRQRREDALQHADVALDAAEDEIPELPLDEFAAEGLLAEDGKGRLGDHRSPLGQMGGEFRNRRPQPLRVLFADEHPEPERGGAVEQPGALLRDRFALRHRGQEFLLHIHHHHRRVGGPEGREIHLVSSFGTGFAPPQAQQKKKRNQSQKPISSPARTQSSAMSQFRRREPSPESPSKLGVTVKMRPIRRFIRILGLMAHPEASRKRERLRDASLMREITTSGPPKIAMIPRITARIFQAETFSSALAMKATALEIAAIPMPPPASSIGRLAPAAGAAAGFGAAAAAMP